MTHIPEEIHMVTLVWGTEYVDFFLKYSLPSFLAQDQLHLFINEFRFIYKIHTNAASFEKIKSSPSFKKLEAWCRVDFIAIDPILQKNQIPCSYKSMSFSHQIAVEQANLADAALIIGYPDVYYAPDFFYNLLLPIKEGKRALFISTVRTLKEQVSVKLDRQKKEKGKISKDALIRIGLSSLFPTEKHILEKDLMNPKWCSNLFFKMSPNHFYYQTFHPNIFYFWPRDKKSYSDNNTIDKSTYILNIGIRPSEFFYGSTENFTFFEASSAKLANQNLNRELCKKSLFKTLLWVKTNLPPSQIPFFKHKIHFKLPSKEKASFLIKFKNLVFSELLIQLAKCPVKLLKPFLFPAYLNLHYPKDKFHKKRPSLYKFTFKTPLPTFLENEYLHLFNSQASCQELVNYLKTHQKKLRTYYVIRPFRWILSSHFDELENTTFAEYLTQSYSRKTLLEFILHSTQHKISHNLFKRLHFTKQPSKRELLTMGKIYRSSLKNENLDLTNQIEEQSFFSKIHSKYKLQKKH